MVAIKQCPNTSEVRTSRSNINKCQTLENYHCLKTEDGQLRELCTSPIWIEAGKCPIYSVTGKLDARICQSISSGTCPPKVFKSNLNFNYPGCLPSLRQAESTTTNIHGKYQTIQNSNLTISTSDEGGSSLVVAIVVPLLVLVIIVTIGIAWWKKKEIIDFAQNIRTTEPDIESPEAQICLEKNPENSSKEKTKRSEERLELTTGPSEKRNLPNTTQSKKKRKGASKRLRILNLRFTKDFRRKNKEDDKSSASNDEIIENQSKLDVENLMEEQEKSSEAKSLQTECPVPIGIDVLNENIDVKLKNNATKADSILAQTEAPMYMSKDVSGEKFDENKPQDTLRESLRDRMANLLLNNDVLVLISSVASETKEFAQSITIKACEYTKGANMRTVYQFKDLRDIETGTTIVLFIHDTFKDKQWYRKEISYVQRTLEITQNAMKTKDRNIHTLICLPSKVFKDFEVSLNQKSLKFEVYDLSKMQEHKTA